MIIKNISLSQLENNTGQIPGINQNPRDLSDINFQRAIKSIQEFPKMMEARELVIVPFLIDDSFEPHDDRRYRKFIVIGGNQRLRALKHLGYAEAPCRIVDWSIDQINEFIIKDNLSYGDWDWNLIANEWDAEQLIDWGLDLPVKFDDVESEDMKVVEKDNNTVFGLTIETESKMNFDVIKRELERLQIEYREFER